MFEIERITDVLLRSANFEGFFKRNRGKIDVNEFAVHFLYYHSKDRTFVAEGEDTFGTSELIGRIFPNGKIKFNGKI
ncbi:hypothetical protein K8R47_03940 [archaeon]|nr:hypothetical protein [archaeon]